MSEADLRFIALSGDFRTDFRVLPLALVFSEIEIVVQNTPDDFFAGDDFGYLNPPKNTPSVAEGLDGDEFGIAGVSPTINLCYK